MLHQHCMFYFTFPFPFLIQYDNTVIHCRRGVRLGAHFINTPVQSMNGFPIDIPIRSSKIHEQYDSKYIINDIAILRLNAPAPLSGMLSGKRKKFKYIGRGN